MSISSRLHCFTAVVPFAEEEVRVGVHPMRMIAVYVACVLQITEET